MSWSSLRFKRHDKRRRTVPRARSAAHVGSSVQQFRNGPEMIVGNKRILFYHSMYRCSWFVPGRIVQISPIHSFKCLIVLDGGYIHRQRRAKSRKERNKFPTRCRPGGVAAIIDHQFTHSMWTAQVYCTAELSLPHYDPLPLVLLVGQVFVVEELAQRLLRLYVLPQD